MVCERWAYKLVLECIDNTGFFFLHISQGVYRVSGSKPRILKLCHAFETQKDQVDLSDLSPHDITSVLKLFFKDVRLFIFKPHVLL